MQQTFRELWRESVEEGILLDTLHIVFQLNLSAALEEIYTEEEDYSS